MRNATSAGTLRDAILREAWRGTVLSMIFTLTLIACSLAYLGLFELAGGAWLRSASTFAIVAIAGRGVAWLCANREDLIDG